MDAEGVAGARGGGLSAAKAGFSDVDQRRLQAAVVAARLGGGGTVAMQLDGTINIEVRHSKEEPPALVEQMRALRLAELDITKQRQQRYASKVQAKETNASSDASDGEQPLSTRARRRRRKKAAQDAKILALQQQLAGAGLASATAPAPAAPAAAPQRRSSAPHGRLSRLSPARPPWTCTSRRARRSPTSSRLRLSHFSLAGEVRRRLASSPQHPPALRRLAAARRGYSSGRAATAMPLGKGAEYYARLPLAPAVAPRADTRAARVEPLRAKPLWDGPRRLVGPSASLHGCATCPGLRRGVQAGISHPLQTLPT